MKVAHLVTSFIEDGAPGDELVDLAAASDSTGVEPVVVVLGSSGDRWRSRGCVASAFRSSNSGWPRGTRGRSGARPGCCASTASSWCTPTGAMRTWSVAWPPGFGVAGAAAGVDARQDREPADEPRRAVPAHGDDPDAPPDGGAHGRDLASAARALPALLRHGPGPGDRAERPRRPGPGVRRRARSRAQDPGGRGRRHPRGLRRPDAPGPGAGPAARRRGRGAAQHPADRRAARRWTVAALAGVARRVRRGAGVARALRAAAAARPGTRGDRRRRHVSCTPAARRRCRRS